VRRADPILLALVGAQLLVAGVVAAVAAHDGWLYGSADAARAVVASADDVAHLRLPAGGGYGWPLLLAPLVLVLGTDLDSLLPVVLVLQMVLLVPLGVVLVWDVGRRLGGRTGAAAAAIAWIALPLVALPLLTHAYRDTYVDGFLPALLGLTVLPLLPAAVASVAAAALLLRSLQASRVEDAVLAGALAAFAAGIVAVALGLFAGIVLALAVARRRLPVLGLVVGAVPGLVALAIWRWRVLGGLEVTLGPVSWDAFIANMAQLREHFWSNRLLQWLPLAGAVGLARLSLPGALLAAGWVGAFAITTAASESPAVSFDGALFFGAWLPALPAYLLLAAAIPLLVPTLRDRLADRLEPAGAGRRPGAVGLAAAATLLAALPLLVAVACR
jgi:hypothetical protein